MSHALGLARVVEGKRRLSLGPFSPPFPLGGSGSCQMLRYIHWFPITSFAG